MKYAVIHSGGKQFVAREGENIEVDRLPLDEGEGVEFKEVLMVVDGSKVHIGSPHVPGAKVKGTVAEQIKAPKVIVYKYIPKERYRRKRGHRQQYTQITVDSITTRAPRKKAEATAKDTEKKTPAKTAAKATKTTKPSSAKPAAEKTSKPTKAAPKATEKSKTTTTAEKPTSARPKTKPSTKSTSAKKTSSPSKAKKPPKKSS